MRINADQHRGGGAEWAGPVNFWDGNMSKHGIRGGCRMDSRLVGSMEKEDGWKAQRMAPNLILKLEISWKDKINLFKNKNNGKIGQNQQNLLLNIQVSNALFKISNGCSLVLSSFFFRCR